MSAFRNFDPAQHTPQSVVDALVVAGTGITVLADSIELRFGVTEGGAGWTTPYPGGPTFPGGTPHPGGTTAPPGGTGVPTTPPATSLSFYDGSLLPLGIGPGLFLSSGDGTPPLTNTEGGYSRSFMNWTSANRDSQMEAAAQAAFAGAGSTRDTTFVSFSFNVTSPAVNGVRFDLVFGTDEFPEFVDSQFVDIGAVFINNVNYGLFEGRANQPLSVIQANVAAGNFINNSGATALPIEFDGVSRVLTVVAPVQQGLNTLKVGVADTGDSILDSGLFISHLRGVAHGGFGLAPTVTVPAGAGTPAQPLADAAGNQVFSFAPGFKGKLSFDPTGGGNDVVDGTGAFVTTHFTVPLASLLGYTLQGDQVVLKTPFGDKVLTDVEHVAFDDALFALDTQIGDDTWEALALLHAGFGHLPDMDVYSPWVAQANLGMDMAQLGQAMLDHFAPGISAEALIGHLFWTLLSDIATPEEIAAISALVGPGQPFANLGALFAFAASQPDLNDMAGIIGPVVPLDPAFFVAG